MKYEEYFPSERNDVHYQRYIRFIEERRLISRPIKRIKWDGYEYHHIVPKCYLSKELWKDEENIIILTCREHFIAHLILWKAFDDYSMTTAIKKRAESDGQNGELSWLTARQYENIRKDFGKKHSLKLTGRKNQKLRERLAITGGTNKNHYWIHKEIDGKIVRHQQPNNEPIPDGWKKGMGHLIPCSEEKKKAISETNKKKKKSPPNKNKRGIHKILEDGTIVRDYISKEAPLPEGWKETTGPHGISNIKDFRRRVYIYAIIRNKKKIRYIHEGDTIPEGWKLLLRSK